MDGKKHLIKSNASSLYMHVAGDGANGNKVHGRNDTTDIRGHWYIDPLGHDKFVLRSAISNCYLAAKDFGTKEGTPLIVQADNLANCHFNMYPVSAGVVNILSCSAN
jgi:hypothetical protein